MKLKKGNSIKASFGFGLLDIYFIKKREREEDRFLLNYQLSIANQLFPKIKNSNSAAEKLMHRYFRSALNISEINTTTLQRLKENL
ncbi:MAG: hypothetical protein CM1200mP12_12380 [Gammaproteobacteria bacterium]|nr:MAG: hypothetical protein CM1200mP12_12380 [Gammaproteobacteria bacterium]